MPAIRLRAAFSTVFTLLCLAQTDFVYSQCNAAFNPGSTERCTSDILFLDAQQDTGLVYSFWDFGNGDTLHAGDTQYVYAISGTYSVTHIVEDSFGCRDTTTDTIVVYDRPVIFFTTGTSCATDTLSLFGQYWHDTGDTLQALRWRFSVSDSLEGDTVSYDFNSPGYYSISVSATGKGCIVTLDTTIFVSTRPEASFETSSSCDGDSVFFIANDDAYLPSRSWNFGDPLSGLKNTSTLSAPAHLFTQAAAYQVRLIVSDTLGCRDTLIQTVRVYDHATASFTYSNVCAGNQTSFSGTSTLDALDSVLSLIWDFGDGDTSAILNPTHSYSDTGNYTVRLILNTYGGCTDTSEVLVRIHPKPLISLSLDSVCRGVNVDFQLTNPVADQSAYLWNFGDGFTSSSPAPQHQYTSSGRYTASLTLTYTEGKTCLSNSDSIFVLSLPSADFVINNDSQCFAGNEVCVHLVNQSPLIKLRRVIFDDGSVEVDNAPSDTFVCHTYTAGEGGLYYIAVQVLDSNGCSQTKSLDSGVLIYPELLVDFTQDNASGCFTTSVEFTNSSNQNPPQITEFLWDFGDGALDSVNWLITNHTYTTDGNFTVKLVASNSDGCSDSAFGASTVTNTTFNLDAEIDSIPSQCASNNRVYAHQTPIAGAQIYWIWGNGDTTTGFSTVNIFENPGTYLPRVLMSRNGCDSTKSLDTIDILGPFARFGNITNRYQCEITDTVYFLNASTYYKNTQHGAIWDFGDLFAPNCTTNYEVGINDTSNCRYSSDSFSTKHMYDRNQESCYYVRLIAYDSVNGCADTAYTELPLTRPVAGPDTSSGLAGLFTINTQTCLGPESEKAIEISLSTTQPVCGRQFYWVMWDSTCAVESGNFNANWSPLSNQHNYTYASPPCDTNGYVTIGLIIQNGNDSLDNVCRDTAWYHQILRFNFMDPRFSSTYDTNTHHCAGSSFDFFLNDADQDSVDEVRWEWGDGQSTLAGPSDTVSHTFTTSGRYTVLAYLSTVDGCVGYDSTIINIGVEAIPGFSHTELCVGDSFQLFPEIRYYDDPIIYWSLSQRLDENKEALRFDLGDGNGFQDFGAQPWITPAGVEKYLVTVAFRDSLGCWDTLAYTDTIRSFGVFADFSTILDSFICPQAIAFTNNSTVYDSSTSMAQDNDVIVSHVWNFGSGLAISTLENPERFLNIGSYSVELLVQNSIGCKDSITKDLVILGPVASYQFVGDSTGCEPLRVFFDNQSTSASNFVWQFNDSNNSVLSTTADTQFFFDYERYGHFIPRLTAQGSFDQGGIIVSCESVFPDTNLTDSTRMVKVFERPVPAFSFATDCATRQVEFSNSSVAVVSAMSWLWDFGDGDTSSEENPVHMYADTGHYTVVLRVFNEFGCEDSLTDTVVIAPNPVAWFTHNEACLGTITQFTDSTEAFNDVIYDWQWNFGDGDSSILDNPEHLYQADSTYSVTLIVTNIGGCRDTLTRDIRIHSIPVADFTANPVCRYDSMQFNQQSSNDELPLTYSWDFGDGNGTALEAPAHLYAASGPKTITLIATSPWSCADTFATVVPVWQEPSAGFTINDPGQCLGTQAVVLTDTSTAGTGTYDVGWDFGNGNMGTGSQATPLYSTAGTYVIRQFLESSVGCMDTAVDSLEIFPQAAAGFLIDDAFQCFNENAFNFTDTSRISSGNLSRTWNSGDGNGSMDSVFQHRYLDTGSFTVELFLLSTEGCRDTVRQNIYINPSPLADFVIDDSTQCLRDNLFNFTNLSTVVKGTVTYEWDFGNGNSAANTHVSQTYPSDSVWTVTLIATSDSGCVDTAVHSLQTYPMPVAGFEVDDPAQCLAGNIFLFTDTSRISSGVLTYRWEFGDGDTSNMRHSSHSYVSEGNYEVLLIASSEFLCRDTQSREMTVHPMPEARIASSDSAACFLGNEFSFVDSSSIAYGSWTRIWHFGDGQSDTSSAVFHSYLTEDTFTSKLIVESAEGCLDSITRDLIVHPQAHAGFEVNDTVQCFNGHQYVFSNLSTVSSGTLSFDWRFGDGDSSILLSPSHVYPVWGDYSVNLIAYTAQQCNDTQDFTIRIDPNPLARIWLADSGQCLNEQAFAFRDSSSIAEGTYAISWDFGDGNAANTPDVLHTYLSAGDFTVKQVLISDRNCADSSTLDVSVHQRPFAGFNINDSIQCFNGHQFLFQNTSTINPGTLTYDWRFGDGDSSSQSSPTHTYPVFGDYSVRLVTFSEFNCKDTVIHDLRIDPNPLARIWLNDSFQCINLQTFAFRDSSSIASGSYLREWNFGDGSALESASNLIHTYTSDSVFTVWLRLMSDRNCPDSAFVELEVYPVPVPDFVIDDSAQCVNTNDFAFTNQSLINYGSLSYEWNFSDGSTSTNQDINHTYLYPDTFRVVLSATSNFGCIDSGGKELIVFPKPLNTWLINDTAQCINTNDFQFQAQVNIISGSIIHTFWDLESLIDTGDLDTARTYAAAGVYPVYFFAQSDQDCWDTLQTILTVHPKPTALFQVNDSDQCLNTQDFQFDNQSSISAGTLSYFWEFGDGDTSSDFEPLKTFDYFDTLTTILYARSDLGCYDTTSHEIIVFPVPQVGFSYNDSDQCVNGNYFEFTNESTIAYGSISYHWDLGNGITSSGTDTSMVYQAYGTYPVWLRVESNVGCSDSLMKPMLVYPKPNPGFSVNDPGQCFNTQDFQFTDQSSIAYGNLHYLYRFGDLTEDTNASPTHSYPAYGLFAVLQVLESDFGCKDSTGMGIQVFAKPSALYTINDRDQCINTQNFLFSSQSTIEEGMLQAHYWDFDDGNTAQGVNTGHYYANSGTYRSRLIVESDSFCYDTLFQTLRVFPKPLAAFAYNDSAQCHSSNLYEVHSLASDSTGIQNWYWTIDADSFAADSNFQYHFKTPGAKVFTHRVESWNGCWDTTQRSVFVKPMPDPEFSGLRSYHCNHEAALALIPVTPGGVFEGKNIVNQLYEPRILWEDTVKYLVEVNGCTDSTYHYTRVYPFPEVDLGNDTVLCLNEFIPMDVSFWNSEYRWQDGSNLSRYRIDKAGVYTVTVTNICGTASDEVRVEFLDDLCRIYLPTAFTPNLDDYNSRYKPVIFGLDTMEYRIYNRWGQLVYAGNLDDKGWDGTFKGAAVQMDVYVVVVRYSYSLHGEVISGYLKTNVTLLR